MIHKQAVHTTAECVGVVSLLKPSQTCRVVEIFISDVQNESKSTTTSVKLLALISIGEIGNLQLYLPVILQMIEAKPRRQYLLLHSLKEVREGRVGVGE